MRCLLFSLVVFLQLARLKVQGNKVCYEAKTCIHNAKEKCGINSQGKPRRFLDTCDIKEYNCLNSADFEKAPFHKCESLPPIKDSSTEQVDAGDLNENQNPGNDVSSETPSDRESGKLSEETSQETKAESHTSEDESTPAKSDNYEREGNPSYQQIPGEKRQKNFRKS